jgi:hypothetical protein
MKAAACQAWQIADRSRGTLLETVRDHCTSASGTIRLKIKYLSCMTFTG